MQMCKPACKPNEPPAKKDFPKWMEDLQEWFIYHTFALAIQQKGSLAQLVQSVCLTSRRSAVQIRMFPPMKIRQLQKCSCLFLYALFSWFTTVFSCWVKPRVKPQTRMATGVSILCYKSKTLANGAHPLMIRLCKDGKKKYVSLGVAVLPQFWDFEKNKPKRNCPNKIGTVAK